MFVQLVSAEGQIIGQDDRSLMARPDGLTVTQFQIAPRPGSSPGPATLVAGVYAGQPWLSADGSDRVVVGETAVVASAHEPYTSHPVSRWVEGDAGEAVRLTGYDWDQTLPASPRLYLHRETPDGYITEVRDGAEAARESLPAYRGPWGVMRDNWTIALPDEMSHYVPLANGITWTGESLPPRSFAPGEAIVLDQHLHSDRPQLRDYVVSVRLIGLEPRSELWAWWDLEDSIPGLGAFPTLKWIDGSSVLAPHLVTVAPEAWDGQSLTGALTLYDAFTNRPLPVLDERIRAAFAWIPLGEAQVGH